MKPYEDCDCCEGKIYASDSTWRNCIICDYNDGFWDKYDLDEAEMKGN